MSERIIATLRNRVQDKLDLIEIDFKDINPNNTNQMYRLDNLFADANLDREPPHARVILVTMTMTRLEFLDLLRAGLDVVGVEWEKVPKLSRDNIVK